MNDPKKKHLVWNWPPFSGPRPPGYKVSIDKDTTEQVPKSSAADEYTIEEQATVEEKAPEESTVEVAAPEDSGQSEQPLNAVAPEENADLTEEAQESEANSRPLPGAPMMGPYNPPGPQAGSHFPPQTPAGMVYPNLELARAYVPIQTFGPTYSLPEALDKGTLFPELYRPYPAR